METRKMGYEVGAASSGVAEGESSLENKIGELSRSVSEVYKYELLTTNQYLRQMELVLDIFHELSEVVNN
ncbi:MAG TPA: hypothetical protein VMW22_07610 [Candidatus Desulfaltia sp.]|nr:hypothetical protein [Candidatus Desulfaltia sp.]